MRNLQLFFWLPLFLTLTACPPGGKDADDTGGAADADQDNDGVTVEDGDCNDYGV